MLEYALCFMILFVCAYKFKKLISRRMLFSWKRTLHKNTYTKWIIAVCGVVLAVIIYKVLCHMFTEWRCTRDVLYSKVGLDFSANKTSGDYECMEALACSLAGSLTKLMLHFKSFSDLAAQFIRAYDFELSGGNHGDAHLLPERLATCRQVHPDSSTDVGRYLIL